MKKALSLILAVSVSLVSLTSVLAQTNDAKAVESTQYEKQNLVKESSEKVEPMRAQYVIVNAEGVNYRATPGLSGTVIAVLSKGTSLLSPYGYPEEYADGYWWHYVSYNGTSGYVASIYLDFE